jgi:CRISPR-associated protein (TIGR02584 family)
VTATLPNPATPESFPRRVLLMVTGRTPQVVTETLFALCLRREPAFVPTEVRLVTTPEGAEDARLSLLSKDPGWFHALCQDYHLPEMQFDVDHIAELRDSAGQPLPDIRTNAENDRAADQIVAYVRDLTSDPQCALHVSLAGGRKTMGYFLGYALSLFGRPQDRLSHVLVSAPYESNRDFYYPTPVSKVIYTFGATPQQQRPIDAKDAQVTLADIPFVRLRDQLPGHLKVLERNQTPFSEVVAAAQQALAPPSVRVDYPAGLLRTGDGPAVPLPPSVLAFYGWIARRTREAAGPVTIPADGAPEATYLDGYLREYRHAGSHATSLTKLRNEGGISKTFFEQRKTALKKALEEQLGPRASRYDLQPLAVGTPIRWGLGVEPKAIEFVEE